MGSPAARSRGRWLAIALAAGACSVGDVDLEGKACPCAPGWVCDPGELVCVRPTPPRDGGGDGASGGRDATAEPDAPGHDGGVADSGGSDAGVDGGADAGPPDGGTVRTATVQIARSTDDAEECLEGTSGSDGPGSVYIGSSDIELVYDPTGSYCLGLQLVGLRFEAVPVPRGATVTEAHLELEVDETRSEDTDLVLSAQAADDPASFSTRLNDLSDRARGTERVAWSDVPVWDTVDVRVESPDLSPLIREVTSRPGWTAGNSIVLIVEGSGRRVVESWDGDAAGAAILHLTWIE